MTVPAAFMIGTFDTIINTLNTMFSLWTVSDGHSVGFNYGYDYVESYIDAGTGIVHYWSRHGVCVRGGSAAIQVKA